MTHHLRATLLVGLAAVALASCSGTSGSATTHHNLAPGLAGVGTLPKPASAWPEAGYDARFSSATSAVGPQTAAVRWKRDLGANISPGPVIATDGTILASTNAGVLHDVRADTGADVWTFDGHGQYDNDLSTSPAVLAGGTILWPGPNNTLYAISGTGKLLWTLPRDGQVLSPAIGGAGRVYVADLSGHLSALEITATSHRVVWTAALGGPDFASPSIGQDGTIYTASDHDLVAVRDLGPKGVELWRFKSSKLIEVSNAVNPQGIVVLGTDHDQEYGIKPDGSVAWKFDVGDRTYSSSIARPDGTGWFGDNSGRMRIIDTKTGQVRMTISPTGSVDTEKIWTSVAADAHDDSYWGSTNGIVYGYTSSGRQLFALSTGAGINSYPALGADGTLYIGTTAGILYAIGS